MKNRFFAALRMTVFAAIPALLFALHASTLHAQTISPAPPGWLATFGQQLNFAPAYTYEFDGTYGVGSALQYEAFPLNFRGDTWQLNFGPYYAFSQLLNGEGGIRNFGGAGVSTAVLNADKFNAWYHTIPLINITPILRNIDWSQSKLFLGIGERLDFGGDFLKNSGVTFGLSIKF